MWRGVRWRLGLEGGGPYYLGSTSGVLRGTAGDQLGVAVVEQVVEDAHVFLLGEDGVVGFEAVFLEHGGVAERVSGEQGIWR